METLRGATTLQKVIPWTVILLLLLSVPWAYFGGAIGRAAAVEYATGQRIATAEAREFAARRWSSYLWPPLALLLVLAALFLAGAVIGLAAAHLLSAAVFLLGVVGSLYLLLLVKQKTRSGVTGALAGLLGLALTILLAALLWNVWPEEMDWLGRLAVVVCFPLLLALSITALLVLLVLLFGRGLMMSAISFEATDAFDGITRAGDYVLRRPWHLAFYTVVGGAYGIPCFALVAFLAFGGFAVAALAVWAGFGQSFEGTYSAVFSPVRGTSLLQPFPGFLLRVLFALLCGLVAGWCASFIQSFRAICYALVRKSVDLSETSEVYLDISRVPAAPAAPEGAGEENAHQPQP